MGKWIVIFTAVFLFGPNISYTNLVFNDNPLLKAPTDRIPYYAVGFISTQRDQPKPFCTGTPIAPTVILTAAHCLYDLKTSKWNKQLFYYSTLTQRNNPKKAKSYIVPREFVDSLKPDNLDEVKIIAFDFGAIILEQELDKSVSAVFSLAIDRIPSTTIDMPDIPDRPIPSPSEASGGLPDFPEESDDYRAIVGYTLEDPRVHNDGSLSDILRATFCPIAPYWQKDNGNVSHLFYAYKCSTTGGISGAPILFRETDKNYKIVGIHWGGDRVRRFNEGIHIDSERFVRIRYWLNDGRADPDKDRFTVFYN